VQVASNGTDQLSCLVLQEAVSWVTTARSSTSDGVLTCITNGRWSAQWVYFAGIELTILVGCFRAGLLSEEQYFACSEACQR
jgi:hypothetical protein